MIQALEAILGDEFELIFAKTGKESIDIIDKNKMISCIVMDIRLSDINGIEAARAIRKLNADLPIIFHTGHPGDFIEDTLVNKEGAFDFITKGDSITRLIKAIRNACSSYKGRKARDNEQE